MSGLVESTANTVGSNISQGAEFGAGSQDPEWQGCAQVEDPFRVDDVEMGPESQEALGVVGALLLPARLAPITIQPQFFNPHAGAH